MTDRDSIWWWRLEAADGSIVAPEQPERFPTRSDAESWIGEAWSELAASGISSVTLLEGERQVYGPMSLRTGG